MSTHLQELQEDLIDYFKDMDDKTFVAIVDLIAYHKGTSNIKLSKLSEKFLADNGLTEAYVNYLIEIQKPSGFFVRHPTDIKMIEEIKSSLLSLSHNRFRDSLAKVKPKAKSTPLATKLSRVEKDDLKVVIESAERSNSALLGEGEEDYTRSMFDGEEANELIAERKRLSKLFPKVLTILK